MKLVAAHIRNFRGLRTQVDLEVGDFTALIGKNEAGKSSILEALAIFFGVQKIDAEDASKDGAADQVAIGCEFTDLPPDIVLDSSHKTTLVDEELLNGNGRLEIWKVFDCTAKKIGAADVFANAMLPTDPQLKELLLKKIAELKKIAIDRKIATSDVNLSICSEIRACIRKANGGGARAPFMLPLDKEDAKTIWSQIEAQMPAFALFKSDRPSTDQDEEAQNPLKLAVTEAMKAQQATLAEVAHSVEAKVTTIAKATLSKLQEIDPELASELKPEFGKPDWSKVFKISLTSDQGVAVNKRGSGIRRLILLSFFRAEAEERAHSINAPGMIYAIEEPETSQHPDNQRMLCQALSQLSEQNGCQVMISTHTPGLARTLPLPSLRYLMVSEDGKRTILSGDDETYREVCSALGVHRDHDVKVFVMVEGSNDIEFLKGISAVLIAGGEGVPDLQALEDQGKLIFVPTGGSNLICWKNRLENVHIKEFHLYDRDSEPGADSPHQVNVDEVNHGGPRCHAVLTGKREMENYIHADAITAVYGFPIAHSRGDDVPMLVAELQREASAPGTWTGLNLEERKKFESRAKKRLNGECVKRMTPALLSEVDPDGDVRGWLNEIAGILAG